MTINRTYARKQKQKKGLEKLRNNKIEWGIEEDR